MCSRLLALVLALATSWQGGPGVVLGLDKRRIDIYDRSNYT